MNAQILDKCVEVRKMKFKHKGLNLKYQAVLPRNFDISCPVDVSFDFKDTQEIDFLIAMLSEFRDVARKECGYWEREVYG